MKYIIGIVAGIVILIRVYHQVVPWSLGWWNPLPYLIFSVDHGYVISPDGKKCVHVEINDAGAMHSGNHWMFVVQNSWLSGKHVISGGYVEDSMANPPVRWIDGSTLEMRYLQDGKIESRGKPERIVVLGIK